MLALFITAFAYFVWGAVAGSPPFWPSYEDAFNETAVTEDVYACRRRFASSSHPGWRFLVKGVSWYSLFAEYVMFLRAPINAVPLGSDSWVNCFRDGTNAMFFVFPHAQASSVYVCIPAVIGSLAIEILKRVLPPDHRTVRRAVSVQYEVLLLPFWSVGFATIEWALDEKMGWIYVLVVLAWLLFLHREALHYTAIVRNEHNPYHRFSVRFNLVVLACKQTVPLFTLLSRVTGGWIGGGLLLGLYICMFAFLLVVNIYSQPCRGSGRFANNFRSASFGSSLWLSAWSIVVYTHDYTESIQSILAIGLGTALIVFVVVWLANDQRAVRFSVPKIPLSDLLNSSSEHVRAVAYRLIECPRDVALILNMQPVDLYNGFSDMYMAAEAGMCPQWERCEILVASVHLIQHFSIQAHLGRSAAEQVCSRWACHGFLLNLLSTPSDQNRNRTCACKLYQRKLTSATRTINCVIHRYTQGRVFRVVFCAQLSCGLICVATLIGVSSLPSRNLG